MRGPHGVILGAMSWELFAPAEKRPENSSRETPGLSVLAREPAWLRDVLG